MTERCFQEVYGNRYVMMQEYGMMKLAHCKWLMLQMNGRCCRKLGDIYQHRQYKLLNPEETIQKSPAVVKKV